MYDQPTKTTPVITTLTWAASALAATVGLALDYGFHDPIVSGQTVRITLLAALGLFLLSRLLMLFPFSSLGTRLRRWWADYVLIIAAVPWWAFDYSKEPIILRIAAVYVILVGIGAIFKAGIDGLIDQWAERKIRLCGRRLFIGTMMTVLIASVILTLPICWAHTYPVSGDETYSGQFRHELTSHWLNCLFTTTAALTGTGLAVCDIGYEFSQVGHVAILILMQIGGLAILCIGTAIGWRLRRLMNWGTEDDPVTPTGLYRTLRFVLILTLLIEAAGTAAIYHMWDADIDTNFNALQQKAAIIPGDYIDEGRLLNSIFHAVSAFCNNGQTLTRDSMIPYQERLSIYTILLPLMVIGSIGGPVLYELWRRLGRRRIADKSRLSIDSKVTLLATILLVAIGAGFIYGIESTRHLQQRYALDNPVERIELSTTTQAEAFSMAPVLTTADSRVQQINKMDVRQRGLASLFQSISARSCGMRTARLDDNSISPASRGVMMVWMIIGGGIGGATGGLRIIIFTLLICMALSKKPRAAQAVSIAAGLATAMWALIALTTFALIYRESASPQACVFEAVSACCNVGLTAGVTGLLSVQGKIVITLAMILGRLIPFMILLRCMYQPRAEAMAAPSIIEKRLQPSEPPPPTESPEPPPPPDISQADEGAIPLE